jgi:hypothetical protein
MIDLEVKPPDVIVLEVLQGLGVSGGVLRFGEGAPSDSLGKNGDLWWDTANGRVYQREAGTYVQKVAISSGSGSDAHYLHTQGAASATWVVTHGLGKRPSVTVIDSQGDEVEGDISHDSTTQATLTFSAPFAGVAFFN